MKETPTLSPEKKENENMFFMVSVRTASGDLLMEIVTAEDKDGAIEKMGNAFPSLSKGELKKADVKNITREEYDREQRRRYARRNKIK